MTAKYPKNSAAILFALLLSVPCFSQTSTAYFPAEVRTPKGLIVQVQDQPGSRPGQSGEKSTATPSDEQIISPQQAEELFKSVDEILKFVSEDSKFPIKPAVNRRLVGRIEVQSYVEQ